MKGSRASRLLRPGYQRFAERTAASAAAPPGWPGLTTVQSLAVASQFGLTLAIGVGLGLLLGRWLDSQIHSGIALTLIGALIGLAAGVASIVALYRATLRASAREWRAEQHSTAAPAARSGDSPLA